jgi:NAD(P)-dependent dehydrogenase (short-subunit alcohol dehydrogenase family)
MNGGPGWQGGSGNGRRTRHYEAITHFSGYCAPKAGVIHFTRVVAQEVS